jgi:uncharacterized protein YndB with AHSA1/START domain
VTVALPPSLGKGSTGGDAEEAPVGERIEESVEIDAPAERVYEMVADLPGMGRWSPENQGGRWLGGATEASPGARFKGRNRNGWRRWSTKVTIVAADPGRELGWEVRSLRLPVSEWRYRFEPTARGGTRVVEITEDRRGKVILALSKPVTGVSDRPNSNREAMRATLQRLKEAAEAAVAR